MSNATGAFYWGKLRLPLRESHSRFWDICILPESILVGKCAYLGTESLYHLDPMSQSEIASKFLKSSGNITMVIENLEKRVLVQRERNANDRRVVTVSLTQAGRQLIERIFPDRAAAIVQRSTGGP